MSRYLFYCSFFLCSILCVPQASFCTPSKSLNERVAYELDHLRIPPKPWMLEPVDLDSKQVLDVAIIGGGMAGMTVGFTLMREGITNIGIYDENPKGLEGPWEKCARMKCLRSSKAVPGPAVGIPSLTFRAWFEACYGEDSWCEFELAPTESWSAYLRWYREVLQLPVNNEMTLKAIIPLKGCFELIFESSSERKIAYARKVVLATGRDGFGGFEIPDNVKSIPKKYYAHTGEKITPSSFYGKKIVVIGAGASAFDTAAVALENEAEEVVMLVRRKELPAVSKFAKFGYPGMSYGFNLLSDETRCRFFADTYEYGTPPPKTALDRLVGYDNFRLYVGTSVERYSLRDEQVVLKTNRGEFICDYVVFGTGYLVDGARRPELKAFFDEILLWEDHASAVALAPWPKMGRFPYLGNHLQFLEKVPGRAPFLKDIYCFNYGAFLSHGLISGDISGIGVGANRLAQGIVADFFLEDQQRYLQAIKDYDQPLFDERQYNFIDRGDGVN